MGFRVGVLGGGISGVGAALLAQAKGHEVWGLSRNENSDKYIVKGDLCDITEKSLPTETVFDLLIHAASYVPLDEMNSNLGSL